MAPMLGLEFMEGQKTYHWWGVSVGDYPLPKGFLAEDLGKCDHALRVVGHPGAYEVGICKRRDGKPGYALLYDFYQGGYGLEEKIGKGANKLKQAYGVACTQLFAQKNGYQVQQRTLPNGNITVTLSR